MLDGRSRPPRSARAVSSRAGERHSRHRLPALPTALIGRDDEIAALPSLLLRVDVRLVTLVGPPGIGKTRLALEVAAAAAPRFQHRAAFVDLAPISDPALVPHAIAQVLGVVDASHHNTVRRLIDYLEEKRFLLILDNFEHVVGAATDVVELLSACSGVKVLATSREPLHLTWEREVPVRSLQVPDLTRLPAPHELPGYSAVALFLERARAIRPDLTITRQNAAAIAEICVRLDGLPLAIEMAAARLRSLTPEALVRRLDFRLELLTAGARDVPERQHTLRSAIGWSYDLLKPSEQALFRRLAVFAGGSAVDAAQAVCDGDLEIDVVDGLEALVDKSLLRHEPQPDGSSRFRLLESLREFGVERLAAAGEQESTRRRHAVYFVALAQRAEPQLLGHRQSTWFKTLEMEHANLQAALGWCLDSGNIALGLQGAGALSLFWNLRGHWSIGRAWLERLLDAYGSVPDALRARGLGALGNFLWYQADYERAQAVLEQSLAEYRRLGDMTGVMNILYSMSDLYMWREEYVRSDEVAGEALALARRLNDAAGISQGLAHLSSLAVNRGAYGAVAAPLQEALRIAQEHGLKREHGLILYNLGRAALFQGQLDRAAALFDESLATFQEIEARWDIGRTLVRLGEVATHRGDLDAANRLYEEGLARLHELGDERWAARAVRGLAALALRRGEYPRANALLQDSLRRCVEFGAKLEAAECLDTATALAASVGQAERAVRLLGAVQSLREAISAPRPPVDQPKHDRVVAALHRRLDPSTFADAHAAGREMTLDQAVAEALALAIKTPGVTSGSRRPAGSLTRRECEVATLIAQGLSNRRIAAVLFITEHTVESHVEHILNKLGFGARTQIAAWVSVSEGRQDPASS